jgi:hypothetical protein
MLDGFIENPPDSFGAAAQQRLCEHFTEHFIYFVAQPELV